MITLNERKYLILVLERNFNDNSEQKTKISIISIKKGKAI